jgi:hypothetical protein
MDGSSRSGSIYIPIFNGNIQSFGKIDLLLRQLRALAQASFKLLAILQSITSRLSVGAGERAPASPSDAESDATVEPDPAQIILEEFEALPRDQQSRVAQNLALLWSSFQDQFGGVSGFLAVSVDERGTFLDKLDVAVARMESARGSEAAHRYVAVALMQQYISFFHLGRADDPAVALAACVATLIDRGRQIALARTSAP